MPSAAGKAPLRVFITGASSGIGRALAGHYAARGAALGLLARRAGELSRLAAELKVVVRTYAGDVRDAPFVRDAAADFVLNVGPPDIVIANAGVSRGTLTEARADLQAFEQIIGVNLLGLPHTFQPFIAPMREAGGGKLVGIASVAGYRGLPGGAAYSASKAAAISYLEALRIELLASKIQVITICPGYVATPMTAENPYPMPFLLSAPLAAAKIAQAIDRGRTYAVVPWPMAIVGKIMRILPNWLFDRLLVNAPRKPR
jgi:short-subunit dehydrogenase